MVTRFEDVEGKADEEVLFDMIESKPEFWMRGSGMSLGTELRYEGGGGLRIG